MENLKILIDGVEKEVFGLFYIYDSKYYFIYTEKELDENDYAILYMTQIGKETQNTPTGPVETGYMVGMEITDPEEQKKVQTSISYIVEDKKNGTINPQLQYLPITMLTNLKIISKKRFKLLKSLMIENFKLTFDTPVVNAETVQPSSIEATEVLAAEPVVPTVTDVFDTETVVPAAPETTTVEPTAESSPAPEPKDTLQTLEPLVSIDSLLNPTVEESVTQEEQSELEVSQTKQPEVPVQEEKIVEEPAPESLTDIFNPPSNSESNNTSNEESIQSKEAAKSNVENNVIIDYRAKYFEEEEKNKELEAQIEQLTKKLDEIRKIVE